MARDIDATRKRRLIGVITLLVAMFIPAQAAVAQYGPPDEPTLEVELLQPVCDGGVPYLQYMVHAVHGGDETATITWLHPDDPSRNVVQSNLPMSGTVLWPGAEVDAEGNPTDWPGWRLEGDEWVEGDEWDWVRPSVQVTIAVNPEATVTVAYPPSSPNCATDPPGRTVTPPGADAPPAALPPNSSSLPMTGATVGWLAAAGVALLMLGIGALTFARKRATRG